DPDAERGADRRWPARYSSAGRRRRQARPESACRAAPLGYLLQMRCAPHSRALIAPKPGHIDIQTPQSPWIRTCRNGPQSARANDRAGSADRQKESIRPGHGQTRANRRTVPEAGCNGIDWRFLYLNGSSATMRLLSRAGRRLGKRQQSPMTRCLPFFLKVIAVFFQELALRCIVHLDDVLVAIQADHHNVVQRRFRRQWFQSNDQRAAFLQMLSQIVPASVKGESSECVLLKVMFQVRGVNSMRLS